MTDVTFTNTDAPLVQQVNQEYTYVEVTIQLADREVISFRREFGVDVDPLEKLENLVDAVKDYLESD